VIFHGSSFLLCQSCQAYALCLLLGRWTILEASTHAVSIISAISCASVKEVAAAAADGAP